MTESTVTQALKAAHHELTTLHGLVATDQVHPQSADPAWQWDNAHYEDTIYVNTIETINLIEQALAGSERSLSERIEVEFNQAVDAKAQMQFRAGQIHHAEETAKMDRLEEWTAAKNNEVRRAIVLSVLADDEAYHEARSVYQEARDRYRLALLEIERLKLLVEARKAVGSG